MNKIFTFLFLLFVLIPSIKLNAQVNIPASGDFVLPPEYSGTAGTAIFAGPLATTQRTYQLLIHESLLTGLTGLELKGLSWRILPSASAPWPPVDITYSNYDFYLSGSVPPAERNLTDIRLNIVGEQKQVRSGSLFIRAGSYPAGTSPNEWGPQIDFDSSWIYTGGHLLIEMRHLGMTGANSSSIDAVGTSTSGYATLFSACWNTSYTGITGTQGNFAIIKISADVPVPVELTSFNASAAGSDAILNWMTATETNNYGFEIHKYSNSTWQKIGFISGHGTTSEFKSYSFTDTRLNPGTYTYRLRQVDYNGIGTYSQEVEVEIGSPLDYMLGQNYPNPFNPSTTITFALKEKTNVKLTIYNSLGEEAALLLDEDREAGYHQVNFNASLLMSGVYFYELRTKDFVQSKKMLLVK